MRLEDSLIMLSDGYDYGVRWLKENEEDMSDTNIKDVIRYILEKKTMLDRSIESKGADNALRQEINRYYKNVGRVVIDPIAFVPLLAKSEEVNYLSYMNVLIDPIIENKVKEGEFTVKQYIDLVMTGSELQIRLEGIQEEFPDWYEQLKDYERKAMVNEIREWFKYDALTEELKKQLSPHNLYDLIWVVGQSGINKGNNGHEYRRWLADLGYTGHPVNYSLENKVGLYKWFNGYVLGKNVQPTEKEVQVSTRIMKMFEEEFNKGNIRAEDIHVITDRGHNIAYKVGDYTLVIIGRVELFEMNKEVRLELRSEIKILDKSVHKVLVRDMEKIVKLMVK